MRILFSPVGTADPLSLLGDGPMLHIVRHYQPDKIVLFLSPKMKEFEQSDSRNRKAIGLLSHSIEGYSPEVIDYFSAYEEVHRYDYYINEFAQVLNQLDADNLGAEILINVTSGTPAMQQALVAFDAFDSLGLRAVQVPTPSRGMNQATDREDPHNFDLKPLWSLNPDNSPSASNRCIEVESAHFSEFILRDNVRTLVEQFDYPAALHLAMRSKTISEEALRLIEGSTHRFILDASKSVKLFSKTEFSYDPANILPEYLWTLEVRYERKLWADYLRAITPAITETMFFLLRQDLPEKAWLMEKRNGGFERKLDLRKIQKNQDLYSVLEDAVKSPRNHYVSNGHLIALLREYCPEKNTVKKMEALRELEYNVRHKMAHEIKCVDKTKIESLGGISLKKALNYLFELNNIEPGLYNQINSKILDYL